MVDALASGGDEGRGKLRKASGSCIRALIRRCPNGETRLEQSRHSTESQRGELKHLSTPRNRKQVSDSLSSGERTGRSPNPAATAAGGCRAPIIQPKRRRSGLESRPTEGDRPVDVSKARRGDPLSKTGPEKSCLNQPAPSGKAKYSV